MAFFGVSRLPRSFRNLSRVQISLGRGQLSVALAAPSGPGSLVTVECNLRNETTIYWPEA